MTSTIAILWQRFGPYHVARLAGAARALEPNDVRPVGIEIASADHYDWNAAPARGVDKRTLFPDSAYQALSQSQISRAVTAMLDQLDPVAVAVNGWAAGEALAATAWCRRHRRAAILMSETHESSGQWWKQWIKSRRVRRCDAALVGGAWQARYLQALGFPKDRIFLGYDSVDNHYFEQGADAARQDAQPVRQQLSLPQNYFYANTRLLPRKNIDGLLRAFALYRRRLDERQALGSSGRNDELTFSRRPGSAGASPSRMGRPLGSNDGNDVLTLSGQPWHLVISGSGEMEGELKSLAAQLGIADSVHWPGFVQYDDLPRYYGLAGAFVHPARSEAWGLVVNEAAAAGLPLIVARRVGAACELLEDGRNGSLVDPDDVPQMSAALTCMSQLEDAERAAMGQRSRALVARFAPERFGEALWAAVS